MENLFSLLTDPNVWMLILAGNIIGLIFGAIPGLSGSMAFIVLLPLTYGMQPEKALLFLMGLLGAQYFGGSIPAILIGIPGTPLSAASVLDGFPMAKRGEAGRAIGITATSATFGGLIGLVILVIAMPFVRELVLIIGSPEMFWIVFIGLLTIGLAAQGENLMKSLTAGGIGMMLSLIGFSPVLGLERYTMGNAYLWDGIQLAPIFIGLFAIPIVMEFIIGGNTVAQDQNMKIDFRSVRTGMMDVIRRPKALIRSSLLGTAIGIVPGIGGTAANFICYLVEKQFSKTPEKFGTGQPEGLLASEASINAKEGGSMLPTLAFGIPGSLEGALVLAAFILHGIQPGPFLIREQSSVVWSLIIGLILSQILASLIGLALATPIAKLTKVKMQLFAPVIVVFSFLGAYLWNQSMIDVVFALVAGVISYFLKKSGYSVVTLIIGFILGKTAERAFYQSMASSLGSYTVFFKGLALYFAIFAALLLVGIIFLSAKKIRKEREGITSENSLHSVN